MYIYIYIYIYIEIVQIAKMHETKKFFFRNCVAHSVNCQTVRQFRNYIRNLEIVQQDYCTI